MPLDKPLERELQQGEIERAVELEGAGCVVGDPVVEDLAQEPEELLRMGERSRAVRRRAA